MQMKKRILFLVITVALFCGGCSLMTVKEDGDKTANTKGTDKNEVVKIPEKFEEWKIEDMIQFLVNEGVMEKEKWIQKSGATELQGTGITGCVGYYSDDEKTILEVMYFDPNSSDAKTKEQLQSLKKDHMIVPGGSAYVPEHQVGNFIFNTVGTKDKEFLKKYNACYEKMLKEYNVKPEF